MRSVNHDVYESLESSECDCARRDLRTHLQFRRHMYFSKQIFIFNFVFYTTFFEWAIITEIIKEPARKPVGILVSGDALATIALACDVVKCYVWTCVTTPFGMFKDLSAWGSVMRLFFYFLFH